MSSTTVGFRRPSLPTHHCVPCVSHTSTVTSGSSTGHPRVSLIGDPWNHRPTTPTHRCRCTGSGGKGERRSSMVVHVHDTYATPDCQEQHHLHDTHPLVSVGMEPDPSPTLPPLCWDIPQPRGTTCRVPHRGGAPGAGNYPIMLVSIPMPLICLPIRSPTSTSRRSTGHGAVNFFCWRNRSASHTTDIVQRQRDVLRCPCVGRVQRTCLMTITSRLTAIEAFRESPKRGGLLSRPVWGIGYPFG
jgi:hypothetical protein